MRQSTEGSTCHALLSLHPQMPCPLPGEYRKIHARILEYCESIVFYNGVAIEANRAHAALNVLSHARCQYMLSAIVSTVVTICTISGTALVSVVILLCQQFYVETLDADR